MRDEPTPLHIRVMRPGGIEHFAWAGAQLTVGRAATSDVAIPHDAEISRVHATVEWMSHGWCVRDLASRNGTFLNGSRVHTRKALTGTDELRVGRSRLLLSLSTQLAVDHLDRTDVPPPPPEITAREREVILTMLLPFTGRGGVGALASPGEIAAELSVTEAAVRQHLAALYRKFGLHNASGRRQTRLANEAVRRGAVTMHDVEQFGGGATYRLRVVQA